ncbi:MAG: HAMP domain-containing protein, partial [Polyangiaceae bacterium]
MKLARKIILLLLTTLLVLFGALAYLEARRAVSEYDARLRAELTMTGRALRPAVGEVWQVEGESRALAVLERANADNARVNIRWTRGPTATGAHVSLSPEQLALLAKGEEVSAEGATNDEKALYVYVPLAAAGGAIELSHELREEHVIEMRVARDRLVEAGAGALVAIFLSIIGGVWFVGRPMKLLVGQAMRIGRGELAHHVAVRRDDEIGELATAMNGMSDRLVEAREKLAAEADARVKAVEQLRHADRLSSIGTLASGVAHELGTPLTVVAGRAKMIAGGEASLEETRDFARIIIGQSERMTKIVRGLLEFARRKTSVKAPADLVEIARRTIDLLAPLAKKSRVEVRLAAEGSEHVANVDLAQVEQALTNLVVNGMHSMKNGGDLVVDVRSLEAAPPA